MTSWKKWIILLAAIILVFNIPLTTAKASEKTVYDQFKKNSQQETKLSSNQSGESSKSMGIYVLQFIGSFILIIGLLFFVLKFVSRKAKMLNGSGVFHAIGGHSFGNHRSLQLLMIGDTLYILGVGESITLIRTIPPGAEQTKLLESVAIKPMDVLSKQKWNFPLKKTKQEKWDDQLIKQLKDVQSNQGNNQEQS